MQNKIQKSTDQVQVENEIGVFKRWAWIFVLLGYIFGIYGIIEIGLDTDKATPFLSKLGNLGGYFQGAVGSLWALAGLMFIYIAFLGQRLQLIKQDVELAEQNNQFERQQFESGFFQLLTLQNEIANKMHQITKHSSHSRGLKMPPPVIEHEEGRHLFEKWYKDFCAEMKNVDNQSRLIVLTISQKETNPLIEIKRDHVISLYATFYEDKQSNLGHYFRNLYHVFKFVHSCKVLDGQSEEETILNKRRYTSIARAQLSQYELGMLFYNGISDNGSDDFKPLIERYGLLENFNRNDLIDLEHKFFYEISAYA